MKHLVIALGMLCMLSSVVYTKDILQMYGGPELPLTSVCVIKHGGTASLFKPSLKLAGIWKSVDSKPMGLADINDRPFQEFEQNIAVLPGHHTIEMTLDPNSGGPAQAFIPFHSPPPPMPNIDSVFLSFSCEAGHTYETEAKTSWRNYQTAWQPSIVDLNKGAVDFEILPTTLMLRKVPSKPWEYLTNFTCETISGSNPPDIKCNSKYKYTFREMKKKKFIYRLVQETGGIK